MRVARATMHPVHLADVARDAARRSSNAAAKPFWAALGYRQIDIRPDRAKARPTLVMEKLLSPGIGSGCQAIVSVQSGHLATDLIRR